MWFGKGQGRVAWWGLEGGCREEGDLSSRVHPSTGPACGSHPAPVASGQWYLAHEVLERWKVHSPILQLQDPELTGRERESAL